MKRKHATIYSRARAEHAFMLWCEGLLFRDIGNRLGITGVRANQIIWQFGARLQHAIRKAKFKVNAHKPTECPNGFRIYASRRTASLMCAGLHVPKCLHCDQTGRMIK